MERGQIGRISVVCALLLLIGCFGKGAPERPATLNENPGEITLAPSKIWLNNEFIGTTAEVAKLGTAITRIFKQREANGVGDATGVLLEVDDSVTLEELNAVYTELRKANADVRLSRRRPVPEIIDVKPDPLLLVAKVGTAPSTNNSVYPAGKMGEFSIGIELSIPDDPSMIRLAQIDGDSLILHSNGSIGLLEGHRGLISEKTIPNIEIKERPLPNSEFESTVKYLASLRQEVETPVMRVVAEKRAAFGSLQRVIDALTKFDRKTGLDVIIIERKK